MGEAGGSMSALHPNNMKAIITKVENKLRRHGASLQRTFRAIDEDKSNTVTYNEMKRFLKSYFTADELTDQEVFIVMRYFDTDGEGRIDYNEFASKIMGKDVGITIYNTTSSADTSDTMHGYGNLGVTAEELAKYQEVLIAAVEEDEKKAFLKKSMKEFKVACEALKKNQLQTMFRVHDVNFTGKISYPRFESILAQQDSQTNNTGQWSLKMKRDAAKVVTQELFRRCGLTASDEMSRKQFLDTFAFKK